MNKTFLINLLAPVMRESLAIGHTAEAVLVSFFDVLERMDLLTAEYRDDTMFGPEPSFFAGAEHAKIQINAGTPFVRKGVL